VSQGQGPRGPSEGGILGVVTMASWTRGFHGLAMSGMPCEDTLTRPDGSTFRARCVIDFGGLEIPRTCPLTFEHIPSDRLGDCGRCHTFDLDPESGLHVFGQACAFLITTYAQGAMRRFGLSANVKVLHYYTVPPHTDLMPGGLLRVNGHALAPSPLPTLLVTSSRLTDVSVVDLGRQSDRLCVARLLNASDDQVLHAAAVRAGKWDEGEHPRGDDGRFGEGGGSDKEEKEPGQGEANKQRQGKGRPYAVERKGGSEEFHGRVERALDSIPAAAHQALANGGGKVVAGERLTEAVPDLKKQRPGGYPPGATWDNVGGVYYPPDRAVVVAQKERHGRGKTTEHDSDRVEGMLRHEFGHGLDAALGYPSKSAVFREAYAKDVEKLDPAARASLAYYLQGGHRGPEEVWAEAFAQQHGGGGSMFANVLKHFPRSSQEVRKKVKSLPGAEACWSGVLAAAAGDAEAEALTVCLSREGDGGMLVQARAEGEGGVLGDLAVLVGEGAADDFLGWTAEELEALGDGEHDLGDKRQAAE
jgi:hypothetical protein